MGRPLENSAVWLVDEKGFASQLAAGESTMVSAGTPTRPSPQVAWTSAGRLNLASLVDRGLSGTASTTDADKLVPIYQAQIYEKKCQEVGAICKIITRPGADHGWKDMEKDLTIFADWFDLHLRGIKPKE